MPTPSEPRLRGEWAARTDTPRRSVFGNYRPEKTVGAERSPGEPGPPLDRESGASLPTAQDRAVARAFVHLFLAKAYEDPTPANWQWLCDNQTGESLRATWNVITSDTPPALRLSPNGFEAFQTDYVAAFGHAARGGCPLNEIEYGDLKADPLFQPHRLADLAAFYRAFGLEVAADADERHDHLCLELEFMSVLAAKEAYALEHRLEAEQLAQCRDAQKKFLREHLGRWAPAFARRLVAATNDSGLRSLAEFTRTFVELECAHFGVSPGSEELLLRPVDETADRMCDSCGMTNLPPGASINPA